MWFLQQAWARVFATFQVTSDSTDYVPSEPGMASEEVVRDSPFPALTTKKVPPTKARGRRQYLRRNILPLETYTRIPDLCATVVVRETAFEATSYACTASEAEPSSGELIFWTDACVRTLGYTKASAGCAAVLQQDDGIWVTLSAALPYMNCPVAQLHGILLALEYALQIMNQKQGTASSSPMLIKVFNNSQAAFYPLYSRGELLSRKRRKRRGRWSSSDTMTMSAIEAIEPVCQTLEKLGASLEFHWLPRGKVTGNRVAQAAARCTVNLTSTMAEEVSNGEKGPVNQDLFLTSGFSLPNVRKNLLGADRRKFQPAPCAPPPRILMMHEQDQDVAMPVERPPGEEIEPATNGLVII